MIPWRANQVVTAFVAALGGVTAATEACLKRSVPLGTAALLVAAAGVLTFTGALSALALLSFARNPVRRAVRRGRRKVREACAAYLRRQRLRRVAQRPGDGDPLFLDDVPPEEVAELRRALASAGLQVTSTEILEYVAWCRWLGPRRSGSLRRTAPGCARWAGSGPAGSAGRRACPETAAC